MKKVKDSIGLLVALWGGIAIGTPLSEYKGTLPAVQRKEYRQTREEAIKAITKAADKRLRKLNKNKELHNPFPKE